MNDHPRPKLVAALTDALRTHGFYVVGGAWHGRNAEQLAGLIDASLYNAGIRLSALHSDEGGLDVERLARSITANWTLVRKVAWADGGTPLDIARAVAEEYAADAR